MTQQLPVVPISGVALITTGAAARPQQQLQHCWQQGWGHGVAAAVGVLVWVSSGACAVQVLRQPCCTAPHQDTVIAGWWEAPFGVHRNTAAQRHRPWGLQMPPASGMQQAGARSVRMRVAAAAVGGWCRPHCRSAGRRCGSSRCSRPRLRELQQRRRWSLLPSGAQQGCCCETLRVGMYMGG